MSKAKLSIRISLILFAVISFSASILSDSKNNFIPFKGKLYASPFELSNKEYRAFLQDLKARNQTQKYMQCLYDSTQWIKKFPSAFNNPMQQNYHSHAAYNNYPIVNITKEAAQFYCEWLTDKYNTDPKKKYKKVLFRLPTEIEWKTLAAPIMGHNLPWYGNFPYTDESGKTILTNIKTQDLITGQNNYVFDGSFHTASVGSYKPNTLGLFNVIGNVSEITSDDKQKGGSWDNYLEECTIEKEQNYSLPDPRVGVRIIMEIIEEK